MKKAISLLVISYMGFSANAQNYEQNTEQSGNQNPGRYYQSSGASGEAGSPYGQQQQYKYSRSSNTAGSSQVKRLNRASNLIGAEVRDQANEKIGEVKDVVIDFNSGRVAYVVVDANDLLESDQSLIAVPARVIHVSGDQQTVKVDASRERLEQMRTFSANGYPPIRSSGSRNSAYSRSSQMSSRQGRAPSDYSEGWTRSNRYSSEYPRESLQNQYAQNRNNGDDGDWYYYEWYLVPDSGTSRARAGESENGSRWSQNEENSQGAYGESESGTYGRGQSRYGERSGNPDENENSSQFQSSRNGMPNSNSSWLAYNRYREHNENADAQNSSSSRRQPNEQWEEPPRSENSHASQQSFQGNVESSANEMQPNRTAAANSQSLSGYVRDVDYSNRSFTVEGQDKTLTFKLADNSAIKINGRARGSFSQLHQGQRVNVRYGYRNGENRAFTIDERSSGSQSATASGSAQSPESSSNSSQNRGEREP